MSFAFHHNKPIYFQHQYLNTKENIIPYLEQYTSITEGMQVMEIGCAEGGVLKAFVEKGCKCTGIELSQSKIDNANKFMSDEVAQGYIALICSDIYDIDFETKYSHTFDLIVLKDTIEHIHNQDRLMAQLQKLLKVNGRIFLGFPPWASAWGGHQQICKSKVLMYMPWFHLLPVKWYKKLLLLMGETESKINELMEIKETGISTVRFEKILKKYNYSILNRQYYFINPIYKYKFGIKGIKLNPLFQKIPLLNDIMSTTVYYIVN
ncbi:MAG: class I SAM-dependent methyltransferase [Cytophagales bacterium]|nr:class I SAM-dependent methyltransferase [Cytophagales bacterium]